MAADYHSSLSRLIGRLQTNTPEARSALYERARAAAEKVWRDQADAGQRGVEFAALEEAIWRIELEFSETGESREDRRPARDRSPPRENRPARRKGRSAPVGIAIVALCTLAALGALTWFLLHPAAVLEGVVFDNFGRPLRDAEVSIANMASRAVTDGSGHYQVVYVPGRFQVQFAKDGHAPVSLTFDAAEAARVPVKDVTLVAHPPGKGLWLVGSDGYEPLNTCKTRQENIGDKTFRHVLAEGEPTPVIQSSPSITLVDTNDSGQGSSSVAPPTLLRLYEEGEGEFYRVKLGSIAGADYTLNEPPITSRGPPELPFGRWLTLDAPTGTFLYVGRWRSVTGVVQPDSDSPCYAFRVIDADSPEADWVECIDAPTRACAFDRALATVKAIAPDRRVPALFGVAYVLADAGLVVETAQTLKSNENPRFQDDARSVLSLAQAKAGLLAEAWETAKLIDGLYLRSITLGWAAEAQALAGMPEQAAATFSEAVLAADSIDDSYLRALALHGVAESQASAGLPRESRASVAKALQTAASIQHPNQSLQLFGLIAGTQAKAGFLEDAAATFSDAVDLAKSNEDANLRALDLEDVARSQVAAGLVGDATATLGEARQAAESLTEGYRVQALSHVAKAYAVSGLVAEALEIVEAMNNPYMASEPLGRIAVAQAEAGQIDNALLVAEGIVDSYDRALALGKIAVAQAKAGLTSEATATFADALGVAKALAKDDRQRQLSLAAIAAAQADAGFAGDAIRTAWLVVEGDSQSQSQTGYVAETLAKIAVALPN